MNMRDLSQRQIDKTFKNLKTNALPERPRHGWIRAIRDALGMTHEQIAIRLKVSTQAIQQMEASEKRGTINLKTLEKIAPILNCRLFYTLLPNDSLEKIVQNKIEEKARKTVLLIRNSMALEDQHTQDEEIEFLIDKLKESYKNKKNISFIWEDE